jgi:hypothetical protein
MIHPIIIITVYFIGRNAKKTNLLNEDILAPFAFKLVPQIAAELFEMLLFLFLNALVLPQHCHDITIAAESTVSADQRYR